MLLGMSPTKQFTISECPTLTEASSYYPQVQLKYNNLYSWYQYFNEFKKLVNFDSY